MMSLMCCRQLPGKQAQQHPVRDLEDGPPAGSRHSLPYARHTEPWGQSWNGDEGDGESAEEAEAAQPHQGLDGDQQAGRGGDADAQEAQVRCRRGCCTALGDGQCTGDAQVRAGHAWELQTRCRSMLRAFWR